MVAHRIYEWARSRPDKSALVYNGAALKYAGFARAIEAARQFFERCALPVGGLAIVCIDQLAEAWFVTLGLRMLGLDTLHLNSATAIQSLELNKMKTIACLAVSGSEPRARPHVAASLQGIRTIVVPPAIYADMRSADVPVAAPNPPPFGGHILYTSGTTGTYKKVYRKGELEERRNARRAEAQSYGPDTIYNATDFGLWTAIGFKHPSAVWHAGGAVMIDQRPDWPAHFFEHGVNASFLSPFKTLKLLSEHADPYATVGQANLVVSGGFVSRDTLKDIVSRLSRRIRLVYGSTELESTLELRYINDENTDWFLPVGDISAEIVDDFGRLCETNKPGALRILLSGIDADGYIDDEEASAKAFREGYFYPGDVAVRREDGRIRILGRAGDVLNVRGSKIAVVPLEQEMQRLLGVANICLFGGVNARGVEELVVAIEAAKASRADLEGVAKRFSVLKQFEQVRFVALKEFPRTAGGMEKINRVQLRNMVWDKP